MKRKLKIIILVGCLLTLINIGTTGISTAEQTQEQQQNPQAPSLPIRLTYHADANGPYSGNVNAPVSFSGLGTYVSGTATYEWDFADPYDQTHAVGYGKYTTHTYTVPGEYTVTLTVKNATGKTYKDIATVFISEPGNHLVAKGGCYYSANVNEVITFNASKSTSSGAPIVDYFWTFGDGTSASGKVVTHSYNVSRVYVVTLEVTDSNGKKRSDILHADIGMPYSDDDNFYANIEGSQPLLDFINELINSMDFNTGFFSWLLSAKIYTVYNDVITTETSLGSNTKWPVQIDVNGDGDKDVTVGKLTFFESAWGPSLFNEDPKWLPEWLQFETKLSDITMNSGGDIKQSDNFTICLQLDFTNVVNLIGDDRIDDPVIRIGYNSPPGQAKGNGVVVTHIFRPYFIWRWAGLWPEYGLRVDQKGNGGSFSLYSMFLNSASNPSSKTTFKLNFEPEGGAKLLYKKTKSNEILNHAAILNIPSGGVTFSVIREKNNEVTRLSTGFSFSSRLIRGIGWSDQGAYVGILGETQASLTDFRFDNPDCTLTFGEMSFSSSGSVNLNFDRTKGELTLDGSGMGFTLSDLLIHSKKIKFEGEINGTLNLDLAHSVYIGLSEGELEIGFNSTQQIALSSDCKFRVNDETATVGGNFTLESDANIGFMWGGNQFTIKLEGGVKLEVRDLNFEVGNLIANASFLRFDVSGELGVQWDNKTSEVTISGGNGVSVYLTDLGFEYHGDIVDLYVNVYGSLEFQAGGWVTFGNNVFKAGGFNVTLDLGTGGAYCEFVVNGDRIKVGGKYNLTGGDGYISFLWADYNFTLDASGGPTLSVDDFYFEIALESGKKIVTQAKNIGIGVGGEFNIGWDNTKKQVTITAGGDVSLSVTDVNISFPSLNIKTNGTLEISAGGWLTFGEATFKAGFEGSLTLIGDEPGKPYVTFEINGKNIDVGGTFTLINTGGEISFGWTSGEFNLFVSGGPELEVTQLYFIAEISNKVLYIHADAVNVSAYGDISIYWYTTNNKITITSEAGVGIGVTELVIDFDSGVLHVEIKSSFEIQADGYITFAPGLFEAGFTGSLTLGGDNGILNLGDNLTPPGGGNGPLILNSDYCTFIINGEYLKVGGQFTLSTGQYGIINLTWSDEEFSLLVTSDVTLTVGDLYFEAEIASLNRQSQKLHTEVEEVSIGADGDFNLDWDTTNNKITLDSTAGVSFSITNFSFSYGPPNDPDLEIGIDGTLTIQVNGYVTLGVGTFNAGFTGTLDLGTNGNYCTFTVNDVSIKIGGNYTLSNTGAISFSSGDNDFTLDVSGSSSLSVDDLYFEAGVLKVTADGAGIGLSGDLSFEWVSNPVQVTIGSEEDVSLYINYLNFTYGHPVSLDVKINGSLNLEANGYVTFGAGLFEAGFSGELDLGAQCGFEINGDSITVGGLFTLTGGNGEISFSWADGHFNLSVSGGPSLNATNLYFNAKLLGKVLEISASNVGIGANGDLKLDWNTTSRGIKISSNAGVQLFIKNINVTYNPIFDIRIIGKFTVSANGYIIVQPGKVELSITGETILSEGFGFKINGERINLSGDFKSMLGSGSVQITWNDNQFYCGVNGQLSIIIKDLYFESNQLKIEADKANILTFGGDITIILNKNEKKFEVTSGININFGFDELNVYTKENTQWNRVIYVKNFDISAGGHLLLQSGTTPKIELGFKGNLTLTNLIVTPPTSWYCGLNIGSASLNGTASILMEKNTQGEGQFSLYSALGSISGQVKLFNGHVKIGTNNLNVTFSNFQIMGSLSIGLDNVNKDVSLNTAGSLNISNFNVKYGNFDLLTYVNYTGSGSVTASWTSSTFDISLDANYVWDIWLYSSYIGTWEASGGLVGDGIITADWQNKFVKLEINEQCSLSLLKVVHDSLTFDLGSITFSSSDEYPAVLIFKWDRNENTQSGYFMVDGDSTDTCTVNLAKLSWGTKSVSIGWPSINMGDTKFAWDIPNKVVTLNNGISNLGPEIKYEDTSQSLSISASAGSLQSNYAKTIKMQWEETSGQVTGVKFDTDNTSLAQLLEVGFVKGSTGRKLALYGLQCDDFYIRYDTSSKILEWGGHIYLANHLIYSKLESGSWKPLDVQWDFQNAEKMIKFTRDPDFQIFLELLSVDIKGYSFDVSATVNTLYFEIKWNIQLSGTSKLSLDTNNEWLTSIQLSILDPTLKKGVRFTQGAIKAQDWWAQWSLWPPQYAYIITGGTMTWTGLDIDVCKDGTWSHLWPWTE